MAKLTIESETLTNIANSIREKTGTDEKINPADMPAKIAAIEGGGGSGDIEWMLTGQNAPESITVDVTNNIRQYALAYIPNIKTIKLTGNGKVPDYFAYLAKDVVNIVGDFTGEIGSYAFKQMESNNNKKITINLPNVTKIGGGAFSNINMNTDEIIELHIDSVKSIGNGVFSYMKLSEFPDLSNIEELSGYAFNNVTIRNNEDLDLDLRNAISIGGYAITGQTIRSLDLSSFTTHSSAYSPFFSCNIKQNVIKMEKLTTMNSYFWNGIRHDGRMRLVFGNSLKKFGGTPFDTKYTSTGSTSNVTYELDIECPGLETLSSRLNSTTSTSYPLRLNSLVLPDQLRITNLSASPSTVFQNSWIWTETDKGFVYVPDLSYDNYCAATNWSLLAEKGKIKKLSEYVPIEE